MEENGNISRRELINSSILAGLALTFGLLGVDNSASGQVKQNAKGGLIDTPPKKPFHEQKLSPSSYKPMDFEPFLKKISKDDLELFDIEKASLDKLKSSLPAIDRELDITISEVSEFHPNNIEDLLDQAANLLDRGIKDRAEWDNLSVRLFYLEIELNQFLEFDRIHQQETIQGYYDQLLDEKLTQLNIETLNRDVLEQIVTVFSDMYKKMWNDEKIGQVQSQKIVLAVSGIKAGTPTPNSSQALGEAAGASNFIEEFNLAIERVYNFVQNNTLLNNEDQSKLKEKLLKRQVNWEKADREFRMMRTDIDRKYEYIKLLAFKSKDGVLNLRKRLDPLQLRFKNDFNEARVRLQAANSGLETIFGYPANKRLPEFKGQIDYFDHCISWVRESINWLIRTSQMDQSFVTTVSLRELLASNANNSLEGVIKNGRVDFDILEDVFFKEYSHVRLKGVSIFVRLSDKKKAKKDGGIADYEGVIQCEINIPQNSYYRHSSQITKDCDQSYIPSLSLNRVASRAFLRQPDIIGTSLFNNLSPIGKWNLFFPQMANRTFFEKINVNDIQLDLFITAKRRKQ